MQTKPEFFDMQICKKLTHFKKSVLQASYNINNNGFELMRILLPRSNTLLVR